MKTLIYLGVIFSAFVSFGANADTVDIINTGAPSNYGSQNWSEDAAHAGKITLDQNYKVETILTYANITTSTGPGTGTVTIYSDGGSLPGSELMSADFDIVPNPSNSIRQVGAVNLDWNLSSGTYWIGFISHKDNYRLGVNPRLTSLTAYASSFNADPPNYSESGQNISLVLRGEVSTVPIPAAAWLFGSALVGLVGLARRKKF
jgi:hypothetical protein